MNIMVSTDAFGEPSIQDASKFENAVLHEETRFMQTISLAAEKRDSVTFGDLFRAYALIVEGFTERELSYPEDIERAFAGIGSILKRVHGNVVLAGIT